VFNVACAECHGTNAAGQNGIAPPLVHITYEPGHHGDASFLLAVRNGVRAHHWKFGNMPAVEGLTDGDVKMVVAYIRELQRANGIF
jgi:cytochrome c553